MNDKSNSRIFLGLFLVALAGCGGQVEPEPRTVRVEVPVAVPCRAPAVGVPTWATASLQKGDSLQTKVRALLAELEQRKGYEVQLLAAVVACQ
ncbi:hypothetical protein [Pseudomonas nitroreducens]|uniref:hypothetical protein n=1 Tax=Pseudomonas nitroreducens TaxID=46680 RepID=UPI002D8063CB|nr:hypothetical protein [Pseudomonas nitroreducens]